MADDTKIMLKFIADHPNDAAAVMEEMSIEETCRLMTEIPLDALAGVFGYLDRGTAVKCIEKTGPELSARILELLSPDIASLLLHAVPQDRQADILEKISPDIRASLQTMLNYPAETIGAFMDTNALTLPEDLTAQAARRKLQERSEQLGHYIYVTMRDHTLTGIATIRHLLTAPDEVRLKSLTTPDLIALSPETPVDVALRHPAWMDYHVLPVVSPANMFLGVIRLQTLMKYQAAISPGRRRKNTQSVVNALGELYRIGLAGLIRSTAQSDRLPDENEDITPQ